MFKNSDFADIYQMHKHFDLPLGDFKNPKLLTPEVFDFRSNFLKEELSELIDAQHREDLNDVIDAQHREDLNDVIDALIDIVVVAMGTAAMMGVVWEAHWQEVKRANMSKVKGRGKRGVDIDLIKPEGWQGPRHELVIEAVKEML